MTYSYTAEAEEAVAFGAVAGPPRNEAPEQKLEPYAVDTVLALTINRRSVASCRIRYVAKDQGEKDAI